MLEPRLLLGPHAVIEALRARPRDVEAVYVVRGDRKALRELEAAARGAVRVEERDRDELDLLAGDSRHQGVVAIAGAYPYLDLDALLATLPERAPLLVALDEITDPHNFGAIVRSAVALGADGVITLAHRAAPVTPAVVRASAGATEAARIARVSNLARTIEALQERGMDVVGLDAEGDVAIESLTATAAGVALVVGAEGRGLRRLTREKCSRLARITLRGPIASLNASVAAGIALEHTARACHALRL